MLTEFLAEQIRLAHGGPAWHGPSVAENLEGLTAGQAAARPVPGAHSIWEIVLHATAWTNEVRRRLQGQAPREPAEGDWPEVGTVSDERWARARASLREAHVALAETVRAFPASRWHDRVGDERNAPLGTGVSFAGMVAGLLQHDGYHGGQVGLLRRALNPGPAGPS